MFICPLVVSLVLILGAAFIIGLSYDIPAYDIWRRFSGWNDNTFLMNNLISTVFLVCITLPIMLTVWRCVLKLEADLKTFFNYSESVPGENEFWYHIRTSMIDECHKYDIPANAAEKFLKLKLEQIKNHKRGEELGYAHIEEVMAIPDFYR